jgi:2,3-bisphosphoglycerate-independent phosphoglycerate mutase
VTQIQFADGHLHTDRHSKKLDYNSAGRYMVCKTIHKNAYKFDLQKIMRNHNVFLMPLLDHSTPQISGQHAMEPQPVIVDPFEEWKVDWIFDSK